MCALFNCEKGFEAHLELLGEVQLLLGQVCVVPLIEPGRVAPFVVMQLLGVVAFPVCLQIVLIRAVPTGVAPLRGANRVAHEVELVFGV